MAFLGGFFDPPAANIPLPTMAQAPTNLLNYTGQAIDPTQSNILQGISGLGQYNVYGSLLPQAQGIGQGMVNDPNALSYLMGAGGAANLGMGAAGNMYGAGGSIYGTAFDPQQDLYNRMLAQTTDAARANATAAGLGTTPLGALSTSLAQNNFNIDWQNQQLQRQIAGSQAASALQAGAAPLFMQSAAYPYQASQGIGGNQLNTLANLGQFGLSAAQIPGQQIAGWQQSLAQQLAAQQQAYAQQQGQFQDATALAALQLQQNQQAWNQQQQMFGGLGKVLGGIGGFAMGGLPGAMIGSSIFGGGGGTTGTGWGQNPMANLSSKPFGGLWG